MSRLIRRLKNSCTYMILDLPELCALQYVYLYRLLVEEVNLVIPGKGQIRNGKINIVPVNSVLCGKIKISAQAFISTWGLTESPKEAQMFVWERCFFGAENVLLAYSPDSHNDLRSLLSEEGCIVRPIPVLENKHEYAFFGNYLEPTKCVV